MKALLKYLGKGLWIPVDTAGIKPGDKAIRLKSATKTARRSKKQPIDPFQDIDPAIEKNGYRSIKVSVLLKRFGYDRKSAKRIAEINAALQERGLYALPAITPDINTDATVQLYNYPVQQLGDLFERESSLEEFVFKSKAYLKLGIDEVARQYSPNGTKDKMDFKGTDAHKQNIVLELKNKGGGKSAVEQVLRYAGQLKKEEPGQPVRTILVTGVRNYETFLAISGMTPEQRSSFEWYVYRYDPKNGTIDFVRVTEDTYLDK